MGTPVPQTDLDSLDVAPGVLHRLAAMAGSVDFDTDEAVGLLMADPALTARIFALCRSIEFCRGSPPESIKEAVMRIGAKELYRLTMAVAMVRVTAQPTHLYRDTSLSFWRRAVATAVAMEETCTDEGSREQAYTIGLMHLVGVWILCQKFPADDTPIESANLVEMARFEKLRFGVAYAQVGASALARWGFSRAVSEAVCWQNEPDLAEEPEHAILAAHLRQAIRLSEIALAGPAPDPKSAAPAGAPAPGPGGALDPETAELTHRIKVRADRLLRVLQG